MGWFFDFAPGVENGSWAGEQSSAFFRKWEHSGNFWPMEEK